MRAAVSPAAFVQCLLRLSAYSRVGMFLGSMLVLCWINSLILVRAGCDAAGGQRHPCSPWSVGLAEFGSRSELGAIRCVRVRWNCLCLGSLKCRST